MMVDCCDGVDLRAIEWELARIDPETYSQQALNVAVQTNLEVKPLLIDVLKEIGPLPEDATRRALEAWDKCDGAVDVTSEDETRAALEDWERDGGE